MSGPVSASVYAELRQGILEGRYGLGASLIEVELAEAFGVSRTPVREALRRLAAEGLVEMEFNRRARVAAWKPSDLEHIYELRAVLESYAASRAASRISAEKVDLVAELCDGEAEAIASESPDRIDRIIALNARLHLLIVEAAENSRLRDLITPLVEIPSVLRSPSQHTDRHLQANLRDHIALLEALRHRDADWAASIMRMHMLDEKESLIRERSANGAPSRDAELNT